MTAIILTRCDPARNMARYYRLDLEGTPEQWRLQLVPTEPAMQAVVRQIRISGRGNRVVVLLSGEAASRPGLPETVPPPRR